MVLPDENILMMACDVIYLEPFCDPVNTPNWAETVSRLMQLMVTIGINQVSCFSSKTQNNR